MTCDDILKMEAGDEINLLIAEKIFGDKVISHNPPMIWFGNPEDKKNGGFSSWCGCYSTNIESAWNVVDKLRPEWYVEIFDEGDAWECHLMEHGKEEGGRVISVDAPTAPLAICRAALLTITPE